MPGIQPIRNRLRKRVGSILVANEAVVERSGSMFKVNADDHELGKKLNRYQIGSWDSQEDEPPHPLLSHHSAPPDLAEPWNVIAIVVVLSVNRKFRDPGRAFPC